MRIDQLPVASSITNNDTLPVNVSGTSQQLSIGFLTNAIRDNVYGAPLTASTSSAMTDQTRVYVYTGTTSGSFTNGHWYYYNGSAWTDGGVYNSSAVQTDPTLTLEGVPADAKATGAIKSVVDDRLAEFDAAVEEFFPHSGATGRIVTVNGTVDCAPNDITLYGKSVQDGTPTPTSPVTIVTAGSGGTLPMVSAGKNLAYMTRGSINYATGAEEASNQATRTGFIPVMGPRLYCTKSTAFASGSAYSLNARCYAADQSYIGTARLMDGEILESYVTLQYNTTLNQATYIRFVQFYPDSTTTPEDINLMIAFGDTSSVSYPEYVRASSISVAIPTPNGLPGIAVSSGGNYTDENGQQWICDTIDLAAGTYIQRIGHARFGDITDINAGSGFFRAALPQPHAGTAQAVMCSCYATSPTATSSAGLADGEIICNPSNTSYVIFKDSRYTSSQVADLKAAIANQYLVYVLATPVITALTEEQIAALRSLRGAKGVTNMFSTDPTNPDIGANLYIDIPTYIQGLMGGGTRRTLAAANLGAHADTGAEVPGDESAEVLEDESAEAMANVSDEAADIDGEQSEDIDGDVETV